MSEPLVSLAFFDPGHGLYGSARAGATLLFEGGQVTAHEGGLRLAPRQGGFQAELDGSFSLAFEPVSAAVDLDGTSTRLCAVGGTVRGRKIDCLGIASEVVTPPAWEELDALRSISAVFDERNAVVALASRPRGALGHGQERVVARLLREGELLGVEDARISTVYDSEGRQRSASLELWLPDQDFPHRASGTVVAGSSVDLPGLRVHAAMFRWRMEDREGAGSYELTVRTEEPVAA